jgi:hypothetical protein
MVLAALLRRAWFETHLEGSPNPGQSWDEPLCWLKGVGVAGELEPQEGDFFRTPFGQADQTAHSIASWRTEGLAVLAWALNRLELPAYDEAIDPLAAQRSVGFGDPCEIAREILDSCVLRPSCEIELFATHATLVTWRLRQFRLDLGHSWDFNAYLRGHTSFRESWLEGLRFVDGDLAIGDQSIKNVPPEKGEYCERIAVERQIAVYWIQGDNPIYSKVDPTTLLAAC